VKDTFNDIKDSTESFIKDPAGFVGDAWEKLKNLIACPVPEALPKCYCAKCTDVVKYAACCPVERGCFN
jgi:hypothetical protein